jgi:cytochrome c oxidase cbb3-type subunit 3
MASQRTSAILVPTLAAALIGFPLLSSQPRDASSKSSESGQQIYSQNCSGCHGLDGKGTQRAPNIGTGSRASQLTESDIVGVVSKGVPDRGMPSFQALGPGVKSVVAYVRSLQGAGATVTMPGNRDHGEKLFFGEAGCSQCHMVGGKGGFIAPDLSSYARALSVDQIKGAITRQEERVSSRGLVTVTTADGQRYEGIVRNEDNFSLQLQSLDGGFHFFSKTTLTAIERKPESIMPADYESRLNSGQLNDLVSYLLSVGKTGATPSREQHTDEE